MCFDASQMIILSPWTPKSLNVSLFICLFYSIVIIKKERKKILGRKSILVWKLWCEVR